MVLILVLVLQIWSCLRHCSDPCTCLPARLLVLRNPKQFVELLFTCLISVLFHTVIQKLTMRYSGDPRANEWSGLTTQHTIWMRQHNRIEQKLHELNPHWNGEQLFQETRRIIIALWQFVVYNEYLPVILGPHAMQAHGLQLADEGSWNSQQTGHYCYYSTASPALQIALDACYSHACLDIAWSVYLFVGVFAPQKRLNRSRCRLEARVGPETGY